MHAHQDIEEAQKSGKPLGKNGCESGTLHPRPEVHDEIEVEKNVCNRRKNQEKQRSPAVSDRAQKSGKQIVEHGGGEAPADHKHIAGRVGEYIRRGLHEDQQSRNDQQTQNSQQGGENDGQQDPVRDADPHTIFILCAEPLGRKHRKA